MLRSRLCDLRLGSTSHMVTNSFAIAPRSKGSWSRIPRVGVQVQNVQIQSVCPECAPFEILFTQYFRDFCSICLISLNKSMLEEFLRQLLFVKKIMTKKSPCFSNISKFSEIRMILKDWGSQYWSYKIDISVYSYKCRLSFYSFWIFSQLLALKENENCFTSLIIRNGYTRS